MADPPAATDMEAVTAEYSCTLQPRAGSPLQTALLEARRASLAELGPDESSLYPPHVSVTGFFRATEAQVEALCGAARSLVTAQGEVAVAVQRVICTDSGYVILDVQAPAVPALALGLARAAEAELGLRLRVKEARHLSLGRDRSPAEQLAMAALHAAVPLGPAEFELVLARLERRGALAGGGAGAGAARCHEFVEVMRLPLGGGGEEDLSTPVKRRRQGENAPATPAKRARRFAMARSARTTPLRGVSRRRLVAACR